jgi:hypothetical protein
MKKSQGAGGEAPAAKVAEAAVAKQGAESPAVGGADEGLVSESGQSDALARLLGVSPEGGAEGGAAGETTGHERTVAGADGGAGDGAESGDLSQAEAPEGEETRIDRKLEEATEGTDEDEHEKWIEKRVEKRIGKEVAKRKALEEQLEGVRAELEGLKKGSMESGLGSGEDGGRSAKGLNQPWVKDRAVAEEALATVRLKLRQLQNDPEGVAEWFRSRKIELGDYDADTMREHLEGVRDDANAVRARAGFQEAQYQADWKRQESAASKAAGERFPWLGDKSSVEFQRFNEVLAALPAVKELPHWRFVAAGFAEWLGQEAARNKGKVAQPVAVAKGLPKVPGWNAGPVKPAGADAEKAQAMQRLRAQPDEAAMSDVLRTMLR